MSLIFHDIIHLIAVSLILYNKLDIKLLLYFHIYIYMTKTERDIVNPSKPKFYKRFVDDIINRRNKNEPGDLLQKP